MTRKLALQAAMTAIVGALTKGAEPPKRPDNSSSVAGVDLTFMDIPHTYEVMFMSAKLRLRADGRSVVIEIRELMDALGAPPKP